MRIAIFLSAGLIAMAIQPEFVLSDTVGKFYAIMFGLFMGMDILEFIKRMGE